MKKRNEQACKDFEDMNDFEIEEVFFVGILKLPSPAISITFVFFFLFYKNKLKKRK